MACPGIQYSRQQNDHCIVTFNGVNWRIVGMRGIARIQLVSLDGFYQGGLDLSRADLPAYVAKAASWLEADGAIDNAEAMP